jgi:hypothetical protein
MATIGTLKTLLDWGKEIDPDGSTSAVAELLSQNNGIIRTALLKEGNLPTGHRVTQRTGLPTSYWRLINQGTPSSKATTAQVDEQCGTLTARSEIDKKLVELNGNTSSYRLAQTRAHMESMNQEMAGTFIYGTASAPEEFVGLAARYSTLTGNIGQNVLSAGGSGSDNTSIYLIGWGENTIYGIYPKGSMAGLQHEDLGLIDAFDASNNRFRAYADSFEWDCGLAVEDWRYGVRICNIDVSDLAGQSGTQEVTDSTAIIKLMSRAIDRLQSTSGVSPVFYANRTVVSLLRVVALDKSSSAVTVEPALNQFGDTIFTTRFNGIPVEIEDQLTIAETAVS